MLKLRDSDYSVGTLNRSLRFDISMVAIFRRLKNLQLIVTASVTPLTQLFGRGVDAFR
jgi:hypothetical protein